MTQQVCNGAQLMCSFGEAPSELVVLPERRVLTQDEPAATIMDHAPVLNIPSFGMCQSLTNPTVAAATAKNSGVLNPMPCVPVVPAPWAPGAPTVLIGAIPALDYTSKCLCTWAGVITIVQPGQLTVEVP